MPVLSARSIVVLLVISLVSITHGLKLNAQPVPATATLTPVVDQSQAWEAPNTESDWKECVNVELVGMVCLEAFAIPEKLTVGLKLLVRDVVVMQRLYDGHEECADERDILAIIGNDPSLIIYKPLIDSIVAAEAYLPVRAFTLCMDINELAWKSSDVTGCIDLRKKILCAWGSCIAKGERRIGCFDIPTGQ